MADSPRLKSPRLSVVLSDGAVLDVQTLNPDLIRYDVTRAKHGWPDGPSAPFLWLTFIAWAALRREHTIPDDVTWESFRDERCLSVESVDDDADDNGRGFPFPVALEPDSPSS